MGRQNIKRGIFLLAVCMAIVTTLVLYVAMLDHRLSAEIKLTLKDVSEQNALTLQTEIKSQSTSLVEIAERLGDTSVLSVDKSVKILKEITDRYSFKRMGVILPSGKAYTTDDKVMELSEREYFKQSMDGKIHISGRLQDCLGGEDIIVFSSPIRIEDEVAAVLFATYSPEILQNILAVSSFRNQSSSYVIRQDGSVLVGESDRLEKTPITNIYDFFVNSVQNSDETVVTMKEMIKQDSGGTIYLEVDKGSYMQYTPLAINDWYLLNIIPVKAMNGTKDYVLNVTYLLSVVIIMLFTVFVGRGFFLDRQKTGELERILYVDPVTGGDTYQKFCEKTTDILKTTDKMAALMLMDIDDFKLINEMYGYEKGNQTLKYISDVVKQNLDEPETFARRIGDRYTILALYDNIAQLELRVVRFTDALQNGYLKENQGFILRPRFGIYPIVDKSEEVQVIQNYAAIAHAIAKKNTGVGYVIYDGKFKEDMLKNKLLEDKLEKAYVEGEFIVYYQPKVDTRTEQIVGAEALIRWQQPNGRMVSPIEFIPTAEKSGFVVYLDEYVFENVCEQQQCWQDKGFELVPVSVNLSRENLKTREFIPRYQQIREKHNVPVFSIELEITESAMFENQEEFLRILNKLHELDFKILMDDFGTGYSSLTMLRTMPVDVVKLDKAFVDDYNDPRGEKIITSVIKLAQLMNISVTAEGVETKEQYEFLRDMQCDVIQGYYFSKPIPAVEFEKMLRQKS